MALLQSRQKIQCFPCMCFFARFLWNKEVYANNGTNLQTLIQLSSHELSLTVGACNNKDSPGWGAWLLGLLHILPLLHYSLLSPPIFCNSVTIRVNKGVSVFL